MCICKFHVYHDSGHFSYWHSQDFSFFFFLISGDNSASRPPAHWCQKTTDCRTEHTTSSGAVWRRVLSFAAIIMPHSYAFAVGGKGSLISQSNTWNQKPNCPRGFYGCLPPPRVLWSFGSLQKSQWSPLGTCTWFWMRYIGNAHKRYRLELLVWNTESQAVLLVQVGSVWIKTVQWSAVPMWASDYWTQTCFRSWELQGLFKYP